MTHIDPTGMEIRHTPPGRIEVWLGRLLRTGVAVSMVLLVSGVAVSLIRHGDYTTDKSALARLSTPGSAFDFNTQTLIADLGRSPGRTVMALGLLALIATPVMRVAVSIVAFLIQRDWRFVLITTSVFLVIVVSVFLGKAR